MKRILVTASHHKMADGLKDTLNFVSGGVQETIALSAYLDNQPVEEAVDELMKGFAEEDEVIVLTDLTSGSVNQQFFRYRNQTAYAHCEWYEPSTCISGSHGAAGRIYHGGTDA